MTKKKVQCQVADLVNDLNANTPAYLKHVYDTGHQYRVIDNIKKNLKTDEAFAIIDFSEHYVGKYTSESKFLCTQEHFPY